MVAASQAAAIALQVACATSGARFNEACDVLKTVLIGEPGYSRPATSKFQSVCITQGIPALPGSSECLVSERRFIDPHLEQALEMNSPLAQAAISARPELVQAVKWVAGKACDHAGIFRCRELVDAAISKVADILAPNDAIIDGLRTPQSRHLAMPGASIATVAAMVRVMGLPDTMLATHLCTGFPCKGVYPDSGMFRTKFVAATKKFCSLNFDRNNDDVDRLLERRAQKALTDPAELWKLTEITRKTRAEVKLRLADGPFMDRAAVDTALRTYDQEHVDGCYCVLGTFGVEQGFDANGCPSVRRCDNAKRSGTNACLETKETIAVENSAFPALVAALFAEHFPGDLGSCPLAMGLDDVEKAYIGA